MNFHFLFSRHVGVNKHFNSYVGSVYLKNRPTLLIGGIPCFLSGSQRGKINLALECWSTPNILKKTLLISLIHYKSYCYYLYSIESTYNAIDVYTATILAT
jgi:hypothetical protein